MKKRSTTFCHPIFTAPLLALIFALSSPLQAAGTFTWSGATNGSWSTATNWNSAITSDNQTDLIFNTTTRTLATSGNGSYIGGSRTIRSLSYGSGINANIATSFNFYNAFGSNLTMSADTGNASITVDAGATGSITLGAANNIGTAWGALVLSSSLDVIHNGSGQLTFNRAVTGAGGLTKTGTGTLAFTGGTVANTYGGLTTVSGGTLTLAKTALTDAIAGNLLINGTGTVTLFGAANQINNAANVEVAAGTFALATYAETVNGVKLTGGAITNTSSAGVLTSLTAFDFQSGSSSAILAGTAGANKTTAGTVTLSGADGNTYTGLTTVSAGGLTLNKTAAVDAISDNLLINGTGSVTLSASNQIKDTSSIEVAAGTFALGANAETVSGVKLTGGAITNTSAAGILTSLTAFDFQSGSASAILAGTAGANKNGAGTVTLSGLNTFTGTLNINEGALLASAASATGQDINSATSINLGGGTLQIRTSSTNKSYSTAPITVTSDSSLNWENTSSTNYQLNIDGSGSFSLTGNLTARNISTTTSNNNQFNITRAITGAGDLIVETYNNIASSADNYIPGRIQLGGNNASWNGDLVIAKGTAQVTGAANTSGSGTIIIGATGDAFGAALTFNPFGVTGSITYNNDFVVRSGGFRSIKGSGLTGDVNIFLSGDMNLEGNLNVDHSLANNTRYVELSGDISGNGGLNITRAGTNGDSVRLTGTNTYTGTTTVTSGKLVVSGSIGNSAVTVSGTGTVLATDAAASFGSTLAINNGAILAAGDAGAAGTATVTGATTFNNGSIFSWDINSTGVSYDKLVAASLVDGDTAGGSVFRIVASDATFADAFWSTTRTWADIFTTDSVNAITDWADIFTSVSLVDSSFATITPTNGSFSASGNTLTWTAVPEPTTALAGLLLTAGLLRRRR